MIRPADNQRTAPAGTANGVSQLWRSGFLPSARAKNSSWIFLVMGPREPMPIFTRSTERIGVTSTAVPQKKTSSAI